MDGAPDRQQHHHQQRRARPDRPEPHRRPEQERHGRVEQHGRGLGASLLRAEHGDADRKQTDREQTRLDPIAQRRSPHERECAAGPGHDHGHQSQIRQGVGEEAHAPQLPIAALAPADQLHERGVEKRRRERGQERRRTARTRSRARRSRTAAGRAIIQRTPMAPISASLQLLTNQPRTIAVGTPPCSSAARWAGKRGEQQPGPGARRREQQGGQQNRVGRPQRRDRVGVEREREADLRPHVVGDADQQGGHGCANVRPPPPGFKVPGEVVLRRRVVHCLFARAGRCDAPRLRRQRPARKDTTTRTSQRGLGSGRSTGSPARSPSGHRTPKRNAS